MSARYLRTGVRVGVSIALLVCVMLRLELSTVVKTIRSASPVPLIFAWLFMTLNISVCAALRWRALLDRRFTMPFPLMAVWTYIARSVNTIIPGGIAGDALRIYRGAGYHSDASLYVSSVVADRLVALAGMSLMSLYGFVQLYTHLAAHGLVVYWVIVMAGTAMTVLFFYTGLLRRAVQFIGFSRKAWGRKIVEYSHAVCVYQHHVSRLVKSCCVSVVSVFVTVTVFYFLGRSMSVDLAWREWLCIAPIVTIISVVPLTIGGLGIRDFSLVYLVGVFGVSRSSALSVSITYFVLMLLSFGISSIIYLTMLPHPPGIEERRPV